MAQSPTYDSETLHAEMRAYLETTDRTIDAKRIAQRLARKHSQGLQVVGFRRRGREVLLYSDGDRECSNTLTIHEIRPDGLLLQAGTVWKGQNLERWIREQNYYLDWVRPDLCTVIEASVRRSDD